jgi:hypothetical protein
VYGIYFSDPDMKVFLAAEQPAEWKGDRTGLYPGHSYLVEEGLELVEIVAIDDNYLIVFVGDAPGEGDAGETGSSDNDPRLFGFRKIDGHGGIGVMCRGNKCETFFKVLFMI